MPGAMTPPRYSPSPETTSKVIAVPKSTTMHGPPKRSNAATALTRRSAPSSCGLSMPDRHPGLDARARPSARRAEVAARTSGSYSGSSCGTTEETIDASRSSSEGRAARAGCEAHRQLVGGDVATRSRSASARPARRRGSRRSGSGCCRRRRRGASADHASGYGRRHGQPSSTWSTARIPAHRRAGAAAQGPATNARRDSRRRCTSPIHAAAVRRADRPGAASFDGRREGQRVARDPARARRASPDAAALRRPRRRAPRSRRPSAGATRSSSRSRAGCCGRRFSATRASMHAFQEGAQLRRCPMPVVVAASKLDRSPIERRLNDVTDDRRARRPRRAAGAARPGRRLDRRGRARRRAAQRRRPADRADVRLLHDARRRAPADRRRARPRPSRCRWFGAADRERAGALPVAAAAQAATLPAD